MPHMYMLLCGEFSRVDEAFAREKQVQGWSRAKREALIRGDVEALVRYSRRL
jgi:putative endonuclease